MSEKPYISVVLPVFNEEENLQPVYERLREVLSKEAGRFEIVFVDDGSSDRTASVIEELHQKDPSVKLVGLSRNFGQQVALTAGLDHAEGDVVITMDADLQHPPDAIPRLLEKHREGFEVVSAVKEGAGRRSWFLESTAALYYFLLRRVADVPIDAHASDFRLLDRKVVTALRATRESSRFMRGLVRWVGFRSTTVPYQQGGRHKGRPAYTLRKRFEVAAAGLFGFSMVPLRLCTLAGVLLLLLGTACGLYGAIRLRDLESLYTAIGAILFVGGLQLFFLGVAGEYLGRIHFEVKNRPLYVVRRRVGAQEPPA